MSAFPGARTPRGRRGLCLAAAVVVALAPCLARAQGPDINIVRDAEIEEILQKDGYPIWEAAGLDAKHMKVVLVGDKDIQAFTAGGMVIYVYAGLIEAAKTPNQLIGVIAHETGHITGGHVARDMGAKPALATYLLTMGLGILAAAAGAPEAAGGLLYSANYFATLTYFGYSRTQEASADQAAATFLEKAHMSGRGLIDLFDNFRYEEVLADARKNKFFYDHPLSDERIDALRSRVEASPYYGAVDSPEDLAEHAIMVAKLKAFINQPQQTFIDYKESDTSFPARYARAIAYYRDLQTDKALKLTDALLADYPNNPFLWELKGQILYEAGRPKEAEPAHERSVELRPNAPLLQFNLAQTLIAEEDPKKLDEAITHLQRGLDGEHDNALGWWLMAQAYGQKGDEGRAKLATAEEDFWLGQLKDARAFAMRARQVLPHDSTDWRRATDIVLSTQPTAAELQAMAKQGG